MSKIKIWGWLSSSNVQAALWCLAELELKFDRIDAGLMYGVVDTPDYARMNPNRTIPTLIDGDQEPLFETGAILRYLAIAEERLAHNAFLAGDDFTLADIQFGHALYRYFDIELDRRDFLHTRRYHDDL